MSEAAVRVPFVESVLHATAFSDASEEAFAHALAVALFRRTHLTLLHATRSSVDEPWQGFPPVRRTLERWGLLEPGSSRAAVFEELEVRVVKALVRDRNPARAILDYLEREPAELVVLATDGREGLPRWLRGSVAEKVARGSQALTLFVPKEARGIVSLSDGQLTLRRILLPVDHRPAADAAIEIATRFAGTAGDGDVEIALLHVGDSEMPAPRRVEGGAWHFTEHRRSGRAVDAIAEAASDFDLVVMATGGPGGVLDLLRGSTSEQVLRRVTCPVLAVPHGYADSRSGRLLR